MCLYNSLILRVKKKLNYSVIVTVYNEELFLGKCLDTIINQTIPPTEVIVVDDNSTDNSGVIIDRYPFKKIFSTEPKHDQRWKNRVKAFKLGLDSITKSTELILKIDSDIIIPDYYAETLIAHFQKDSNLAACSAIQNPNQFHPLPRNGAIMYKFDALNSDEIQEVYAWDRWILLWFLERGYNLHVDESLRYTEMRDSILSDREAKRSGMVRRRENYPLKNVLFQAFFQGGLKSLYFLLGYFTGAGASRHNKQFIITYAKKEEHDRMQYIFKRLGVSN